MLATNQDLIDNRHPYIWHTANLADTINFTYYLLTTAFYKSISESVVEMGLQYLIYNKSTYI